MHASRRHSATIDGIADESRRWRVEQAGSLERGVRQHGVERSSVALSRSCSEHALAHDGGRFPWRGREDITRGQRGNFDLEVKTIENRSRDARGVARVIRRGAPAATLEMTQPATETGIRCPGA